MMVKNLPREELFPKILVRLILDSLAFANMIMRGQIKASFSIISAHWNFLIHLPKWLKKRKDLKTWVVRYSKSGIYPKSIVFDYFFSGKKKYADLDWVPKKMKPLK